ncbi:MAG: hypothetical protein M3410_03460, partial [Acidobacteriota bacterium]|nr:hypothetical protein [Acidobacteriota bacterium]
MNAANRKNNRVNIVNKRTEHNGRPLGGICLLSVEANKGTLLLESLLHEAIHALDLETKGTGNILIELQNRLLKAGYTKSDR